MIRLYYMQLVSHLLFMLMYAFMCTVTLLCFLENTIILYSCQQLKAYFLVGSSVLKDVGPKQ